MRLFPLIAPPLSCLSLLAVLATACDQPPGDDDDRALDPVRQAIVGGQAASACQWPTSVALRGCTATLIHPSIITTAGHCGINHPFAYFGESRAKAARMVATEYCRKVAGGDVAYCKLKTPVTDVPITPVLMGCEVDILKPGQKVVSAGFGRTTARGVAGGVSGVKYWVDLMVNSISSNGKIITIYAPNRGLCFGDSGGPAYVQLADGSWRAFGILSTGANLPGKQCENGDRLSLIHKFIPLIEEDAKLDITPCHDADGKWNPSAACRGFSLTPESAGRSWEAGCAEPTSSALGATCGAAFAGVLPPAPPPPSAAPISDGGASEADASSDPLADAGRSEPTAGDASAGKPEPTPGSPQPGGPRPLAADAGAVPSPTSVAGEAGCSCALGEATDGDRPIPGLWLAALAVAIGLGRRRAFRR